MPEDQLPDEPVRELVTEDGRNSPSDEPATELYRSPNGDRWLLMRCSNSEQAFVRHEANPTSGGHRTDIAVRDFLAQGERHPQHLALLRLLSASTAPREA